MTGIEERITALELAVLALSESRDLEFGDSPGHPFRGNQYSDGGGRAGSQRNPIGEMREPTPSAARYRPEGVGERAHAAGVAAVMDNVHEYGKDDPNLAKAAKEMFTIFSEEGGSGQELVDMVHETAQQQYRDDNGNLSKAQVDERYAYADSLDTVASVYANAAGLNSGDYYN